MANKLKDMKLTSVDLCKRGANPKSHIRLFKSKNGAKGGEGEVKLAKNDCIGDAEHMTSTLFKSLESIIADDSLGSVEKQELMAESLQEFTLDVTEAIEGWSEAIGKSEKPEEPEEPEDGDDDEDAKEANEAQEDKAQLGKGADCKKCIIDEGVYKMAETVIEIEKMTAEDQQILKSLQEKYAGAQAAPVEKSEPEIHPEVKKALDELSDLKKSVEMERMTEVAKKYEVIGKSADELAPKLYELKKSGGTNYDDYVAMLDEMVQMQEQSGIFKEHGTSRTGSGADLDGIVADLRKSMPEATQEELIIKAFEMNPNLDRFTGKLK